MARFNPWGTISQRVSDPEFLKQTFRVILRRGIMGLGYGIQLDPDTMKVIDKESCCSMPTELMVVMPEYTTGDPLPLDDLKKMLRGGTHRSNTHKEYVNGNILEGGYDIELILAYNPSAPSLYILAPDDNSQDSWEHVRVYNEKPDDIVKEIKNILETQNPIDMKTADLDSLTGFVDTSIRLMYLMKRSSSPAAINYQEVLDVRDGKRYA